MPSKVYITNEKIGRDISTLAKQIQFSGFVPTTVIGVARGGLVPAVYLSHFFGVPFYCVNIGSYTEYKRGEIDLKQPMSFFSEKDVLIVDDLVDSGETLKWLSTEYRGYGNDVKTAVLYKKRHSIIVPDFFVETYDKEEWIEFPWESI